jgi:hypothetical protein
MKILFQRLALASLVVGTLVSSIVVNPAHVLAIPDEQIVKILDRVPVFFIGNNQGVLLTEAPQADKKTAKIALAFVSPKDAQTYLEQVKKNNPNIGNQGRVIVQPLSAIYLHNKENKSKQDSFVFECCIPTRQQVEAATTILKQNGQKVDQLRSTPLFVARFKDKKGYLVAREGDKIVDWPIFFSREDLMTALEPLKKKDPKLGENVEVEVIDLASLMSTLSSTNEQSFSAIRLVPVRESLEFLVKQQSDQPANKPQQGKPAPQAKPKPATQQAPKK